MENHSDSNGVSFSNSTNQIQQDIGSNSGQVLGQMIGGMAIGQLTVYLSQVRTELETPQPPANKLSANPYQGLLAFRETDGDRFFGRDKHIEQLWQKFRLLHEKDSTVRVLPIYGPSGSGKSSLARAGLIPKLGAKPLLGRDQARLVVLVPGTHPLESLATMLARIVTNDSTPVSKTREFTQELTQQNNHQEYDGLRRIADVFPDIAFSPLIVLVDQFEEVYTLCKNQAERNAFVGNLLCAAADLSKRVSVILTLRSDFLGETQQHPRLNKLFSEQGFLVPTMQPEDLEAAIAQPAAQAGYPLNSAVVKLLVEQTQGREALPLLQFALTRIWEGLPNIDPAETLENLGGVGGALAGEAQRLYKSLNAEEQAISRRIFLALVELGEGTKNTRRRAALSELIADEKEATTVRAIINRFAAPGVRFLATFSDEQSREKMIEVAHEALINNWKELQAWLNESEENLRKKRKIEQAAAEWVKSPEYVLYGRSLRDAKEFMQAQKDDRETALSSLAKEFVMASLRKQRGDRWKNTGFFIALPLIGTLIILHSLIIYRAEQILNSQGCKPNSQIQSLVQYMWWTGSKDNLQKRNFCGENLNGVYLPGADLSDSNLQNVRLNNANLQGTFLLKSQLQDAWLVQANLQGSVMKSAQLQNSHLLGTDLSGANLSGANLSGADLSGADFKNTTLTDADFRYSKGLTQEQISHAKVICRTKLPNNISINLIPEKINQKCAY
ncbi:pentapeptide repeat-containing protein [Nostoc sp. FACHB-87]|uniref:nSTAND1 domain-containing NTPase n=1 Tax=Nostocaceae TaxID=1162 RepID=UPI0016871D30|nr:MULTISPECIES: pentapeptide repeat-containing protein [Nostocaceae]MBD2457655.1 pentapeptide repeat-containing protein [Nostoc sp. FACHB-87]MBD2478934.1 pentapeptide repeat-containing protein [Anabaena sp. FACHB-83]